MRFNKKRFSLWLIVLFIGVVALAIPNAASVHVATKPQSDEEEYWSRRVERRLDRRQEYLDRQTGDDKDDGESKDKDSKGAADDEDDADDIVDKDVKEREDIYEKRREYWRKRLDDEW